VHEGVSSRSFLDARLDARVRAMLDAGSWTPLEAVDGSAVLAGAGAIHSLKVVLAGTDPERASGAIDGTDVEALLAAVACARRLALPLILLLDSAGAKLTEGVSVLGAFRRLEAALLDASASGLRIAVVLGRHCFGGASLLAFIASARICPRGALLGVAGPRALAALTGPMERQEIAALFGVDSRARHDEDALLVTDDTAAVRAATAAWLADAPPGLSIEQRQRSLMRRLRIYRGDAGGASAYPMPPELEARLDHLFPQGWSALYTGGVLWGDGWVDGRVTLVAGFVQGRPVDAVACWRFAQALLDLARDRPALPFVLLLDSPGQAATPDNEQILLSEFIAQTAAVTRRLRDAGQPVELWLTGEAGGAIYVALAAAATSVTAWPGARIQTLPARVVSGVVGATSERRVAVSELLESRVIDRWTRSPGLASPPAS
jgi:acetyl-CoA carboxylase carboxyltransferase component